MFLIFCLNMSKYVQKSFKNEKIFHKMKKVFHSLYIFTQIRATENKKIRNNKKVHYVFIQEYLAISYLGYLFLFFLLEILEKIKIFPSIF